MTSKTIRCEAMVHHRADSPLENKKPDRKAAAKRKNVQLVGDVDEIFIENPQNPTKDKEKPLEGKNTQRKYPPRRMDTRDCVRQQLLALSNAEELSKDSSTPRANKKNLGKLQEKDYSTNAFDRSAEVKFDLLSKERETTRRNEAGSKTIELKSSKANEIKGKSRGRAAKTKSLDVKNRSRKLITAKRRKSTTSNCSSDSFSFICDKKYERFMQKYNERKRSRNNEEYNAEYNEEYNESKRIRIQEYPLEVSGTDVILNKSKTQLLINS